jgi:hypothetical protein
MTGSQGGSRVVLSLLGFCVLLMSATPSAARTIPLFGPEQFARTEGKPVDQVRTFRVPAEATGCRLMVRDGAGAPASANNVSVKVNGVEMVDARTLRAADPAEAVVDLQDSNILVVTLKGKPGDQVTVEILGEIPDSPSQQPPPRPAPPAGWPSDRPLPPGY